jgi:hypothetical protein
MYRVLFVATTLITVSAAAGHAQNPRGVKLADVAGVWDYRATVGSAGGVVVASVLTATADGKGWTIQHDNDPPVPVRIDAVAGDSITANAGPYASTLRPGQTVVRLHVVFHYHDGRMTGPFEARYASGEVVRGTVDVARRN